MYLQKLRVQGFRSLADVTVDLQKDVTVLMGENNAGKSNVMDAIRLFTSPLDGRRDLYFKAEDLHRDGCQESQHRDECLKDIQISGQYSFDNQSDLAVYDQALRPGQKSITYQLTYTPPPIASQRGRTLWQAGGTRTADRDPEPAARGRIRHLYLPPLRDAQRELASPVGSRIRYVVESLLAEPDAQNEFLDNVGACFSEIEKINVLKSAAGLVQEKLGILTAGACQQKTDIGFAKASLYSITRSLRLRLEEYGLDPQDLAQSGLGYTNLLFMATVFTQLQRAAEADLTLLLVEEPEAHLHPQLQALLMGYLEEEVRKSWERKGKADEWLGRIQVVVTTHSPHIATAVAPEKLVVLQRHQKQLFAEATGAPGGQQSEEKDSWVPETKAVAVQNLPLDRSDLNKMRRYLDATRSTMLFGPRVLLVEGIAEAILAPVFARQVLTEEEVLKFRGTALIPIGGTDFKPYLRILLSADGSSGSRISQRVAVITDGDFFGVEEGSKSDRPGELRKLISELGASGAAEIFCNETTFEPELMKADEARNIPLLKEAWKKQRPRVWKKDWDDILSKPPEGRARKLVDLFDEKKIRKGDFAQDLLEASAAADRDKQLVAPGYFRDALRWIVGGSSDER